MNSKIPVRQFAEKLAAECNVDQHVAQQFVKLYFDEVVSRLRSGEEIEIPELGKFSVSHDIQNPVIFTPDNDAAAQINSPFEMFENMELPVGISEEELEPKADDGSDKVTSLAPLEISESENSSVQADEEATMTMEKESEVVVDSVRETEHEDHNSLEKNVPLLNDDELQETEDVKVDSPQVLEVDRDEIEYLPEDEEEYVTDEPQKRSLSFGLGFLIGILTGLIIGAVALYAYAMYYVNSGSIVE